MTRLGDVHQNLAIFNYTIHLIIVVSLKKKNKQLEKGNKELKEQIKINFDDIYKQL